MSTSAKIIVKNGQILKEQISVKDLLLQHPKGIYSTARTIEKKSIFDLESHYTRLGKISSVINLDAISRDDLRTLTLPSIKTAMNAFCTVQANPDDHFEMKLTFLLTIGLDADSLVHHDKKLDFYAVVELMNPPPSPPVTAQIRTFHRPNPTVKNSQWVTDRKTLEESMPKHVNEIVMQEADGRLSEGLSSNFFVLKKDGTLETAADEHVLPGTTRSMVLSVCRELNIPIEFKFPSVREIDDWEGACISSTSRLLLPINVIELVEPNRTVKFDPLSDKLQRLKDLFRVEMKRLADQVLD
jgi:branched-subunit amino acid aminotransferase/4-amino-4-deoxychorismate lyase